MIESKKIKLNFRLMLEGVNESRRDEFWQYIRETHWPQGFLKIYGMSCLLKEYNRIVQEEWINIIKSEKTSLCQRVPLAETNLQISEDICYYIEKITEKDNIIKISGWASNQYSIVIGLRNVAESIFYNTLCLYRSDVTLFFSDGHNYDQSGFQCQIDASELDKASYEIMIGMVGKEKVYLLTHQYVELKLNKKYY